MTYAGAHTIPWAIYRIKNPDSEFEYIKIHNTPHTDEDLTELVDCLISHPNIIQRLYLCVTKITDTIGIRIAKHLAIDSTIRLLDLRANALGALTYLEIIASLRLNSSLCILRLCGNAAIIPRQFDVEFVNSIRLNFTRRLNSEWRIYTRNDEFKRLNDIAEKSTSPSMLEFLLYTH